MNAVWKQWVRTGCSSRPNIIFLALVFLVFDVETVFLFPWAVFTRKAFAVRGA